MRGLGRLLFALSFAGLGALGLLLADFAKTWPLVPKGMAWHDTTADLANAILLVSALGLLVRRAAALSALVITALLSFLLLQQIPGVIAKPLVEASWYSVGENLTFVAGAWTILLTLPRAALGNIRLGQILFALALLAIGPSHVVHLDQTAPLIPGWLPFHVALAYFTGAAHIAAGIGILFGVLPRLAAILEAIMVSLFTVLIWVPMVIDAPASRFNLAEICVSTAVTGAAWAVAGSFGGTRRR